MPHGGGDVTRRGIPRVRGSDDVGTTADATQPSLHSLARVPPTQPETGPVRSVEDLQARLRTFTQAREWQRFHTPKNLAVALATGVGELLAEFQWLSDDESLTQAASEGPLRARVADEVADVTLYLLRLSDVLDLDVLELAAAKLAWNEDRFPVDRVRSRAMRGRDVEQGI